MLGAYTNSVHLWYVLCAVGYDVPDQPHRWPGWENIGAPRCKFLEYIVLRGSPQLLLRNTSLFGQGNVHRQYDDSRCIYRPIGLYLIQVAGASEYFINTFEIF